MLSGRLLTVIAPTERGHAPNTLVHKYGDVFLGRTESRSPFDPSRRRENNAPPQAERIRKRIYEMLH
jgi:hypothetical protein